LLFALGRGRHVLVTALEDHVGGVAGAGTDDLDIGAAVLAAQALTGRDRPLKAISWLTFGLTAAMLAFYTVNPKARNYGGSTSGLRWLFWLIPFWLIVLPTGLIVRAPSGFDPRTLGDVLAVLEARPC